MNVLVELLSRLLEAGEREAVRGDLEEAGERGWRAVREVLGLIARRQAAAWRSWRAWAGLMLVAVPFGIALGRSARQISGSTAVYAWMYFSNWTPTYIQNSGFRMELLQYIAQFLSQFLMLAALSWCVGYVMSLVTREAAGACAGIFCVLIFAGREHGFGPNAAAFSSSFYRGVLPVMITSVLVAIPALWGIRKARSA